jgi:signal transduction histidine kinase
MRFRQKTLWKIALLLAAVAISIASLLYTNYLAEQLRESERQKVRLWAEAQKKVSTTDNPEFLFKVVQQNETVPVILVNDQDRILSSRNIPENRQDDLDAVLAEMKAEREPIEIDTRYGSKSYVYYQESLLVTQLRYFPYVQLVVIALFFAVAYFAFNASQKYEQNRVWVGLAKETAHQLGTPLSSLMGWLTYLESTEKLDTPTVQELEKDVNRLQTVTDRFSKIGSNTQLEQHNLYEQVAQGLSYLRSRFSRKATISIDASADRELKAWINEALFNWVIENLVKNAINAIDEQGCITFYIHQQGRYAVVDVADTGRGLQRSEFRSIFEPGYTTRKRGWGLGLSLSRRIIEQYHGGQIFVRNSEPGKGTTFRIKVRQ